MLFGSEKKHRIEQELKERKVKEYNYIPPYHGGGLDRLIGYIDEYEAICDKCYDSKEEEIADLLRLIGKQNLLILSELKNINDAVTSE